MNGFYLILNTSFSISKTRNLDDITRNIYKENVQLTESFKLNTQEIESLKKQNKALRYENEKLSGETEGNSNLVREKVDLAAKQGYQLKEVTIFYKKAESKLSIFKFCVTAQKQNRDT